MKRVLQSAMLIVGAQCLLHAQAIPKTLWGKWTITRILPTTTIACLDENEARAFLRTELEYSAESFRWQTTVHSNANAETTTVTDQQFHDENSGMGTLSSQVTFKQLGIKGKQAVKIFITHPPARVVAGTVEIPGDRVLIKDQDTIVVGVCAVYFEAKRTEAPKRILR